MERKQSSIEYLIDWMSKNEYFIGNDLLKEIEQAKEMHKQEIIKAAARGYLAMAERFNLEEAKEYGKEYYDNCFGGKL
jgi:rRNA-processing protein FCF1